MFDFEVFPDWWCCVFGELPEDLNVTEDVKNDMVVVTSDDVNARTNLLNMLRKEGFAQCGYNIKGYDLIIANAIYQGFTPEQVKIVSDIIINPSLKFSSKEHMRLAPFASKRLYNIPYQDLMDDGEGSLKEKEAVLGLNIIESNIPFDKSNLTDEEKAEVIYYCKHDVFAAMYYYKEVVHPYTCTKLSLEKAFGIPEVTIRASTNAKLVGIALGAVRTTFSDRDRVDIDIPNNVKPYVYDNLPNNVAEHLRTSTDSLKVRLFENDISFGNGGVHSTLMNNLYIESNDEWQLLILDATSYYPSLLIQLDCLSRAVRNKNIFSDIFKRRVEIKHKENPTPEDMEIQRALKLILNTTFGASGNKWLDLYDPHMCTRTCRLGQMLLVALANKIYRTINGVRITQTNTDGLMIYLRKKDIPTLMSLSDEWTECTKINMEYTMLDKMWQRDVNNYLIVEEGGKIKRKGGWLQDSFLRPGYVAVGALSAFVSSKAVQQYLLNGTDIVESIVKNNNIFDFAITCKKGPSYRGVVQRHADGTEEELFKCNRVYASKDKSLGKIYKYKMYKGKISYAQMPTIPDHCRLINHDLRTYKFDDIKSDIDYMYYVDRAAGLLDMQWNKLSSDKISITDEFDYFKI